MNGNIDVTTFSQLCDFSPFCEVWYLDIKGSPVMG